MAMAKKFLIPVITRNKHDRNRYPGMIYGLEPELVDQYIEREFVTLNLKYIEKFDGCGSAYEQSVVDEMKRIQARQGGNLRAASRPAEPRGSEDPRLQELLGLSYNQGEFSLVKMAKKVAEAQGVELTESRKEPLISFLLNHWETYEEVRG